MSGVERAEVLRVRDLKKHFGGGRHLFGRRPLIRAVDGVSFAMAEGETLGVVGESGCGKSTVAKLVLRLLEPSAGSIELLGTDIAGLSQSALRSMRPRIQLIAQDPFGSLNPRMRVAGLLGEPMQVAGIAAPERLRRARELLGQVGLPDTALGHFPHEFSGGQRQRIAIARALALRPSVVVCDEPVSALDVSIQAQVVNLLRDLQRTLGISYLFISHDLSVIRHVSTRVAVMYLGRVVELASRQDLFAEPLHPYTRALLAAQPVARSGGRRRVALRGEVPNPAQPPPGCHFHPRCQFAEERCRLEAPLLREVGAGRQAACHLVST
jgi:oligopeptide/dipeptide ABC transporter ATP-binding protein